MSARLTVLDDGTHIRQPERGDAAAMLALVEESGVLEPNTCYAYLLVCTHFADTSIAAVNGDELRGFIAGYLIPERPDTVFVWQIGVAAAARGAGLGKRMLLELVRSPGCENVRFLETTVTPSNEPSQGLFRSFAREVDAPCNEGPGFEVEDFGESGHESETLFRIGPFGKQDKSE